MSTEANTAIVRRYIEEWANDGNEAALNDVVAPDWVSHGTQSATATPTGLPSGIAGAKQLHDEVRSIWPDNRGTIEDIFGDGDRVAVRMTNRATHRGTYRGIPPTGKRVTFGAIWIFRLTGGKIAEVWRCADDLGRVVQIGDDCAIGSRALIWRAALLAHATSSHLRVVAYRRCACLS